MAVYRPGKIEIDGSTAAAAGDQISARPPGGYTGPDPKVLAARRYETTVTEILDFIYLKEPWVGTLLIDEIVNNTGDRKIVIRPRTMNEIMKDPSNSAVEADVWKDASPKGVKPFVGGSDDPNTPRDDRFDKADFAGTDKGSSVHIPYDPLDWDPTGTRGKMGQTRDDVLIHELFHALRVMQAKFNPVPTEDSHQDNEEEWLAILITNIYMAEKGDYPLRASHHGNTPLAESLRRSKTFLLDSRNLHLMMSLYSQHSDLFSKIAEKAIAQPDRIDPDPAKEKVYSDRLDELIPLWEFNPLRLYRDNTRFFVKVMIDEQLNWLKKGTPANPSSGWGSNTPPTKRELDMWRGSVDNDDWLGGLQLSK
jgi:hypothetical protein